DLRVAHLPVRQADRVLGGAKAAVRPALERRPPVGHRRGGNGVPRRAVAVGLAADPEAVEDNEDDRSGPRLRHAARPRAAAVSPARATIPAISSGLSEAPPTSAPSIPGSARNSPM